jgi:hypothetical protein
MRVLFEGVFHPVEQLLIGMLVVGMVSLFGGTALAIGLRMRSLRWTWSGVLLAPVLLVGGVSLGVSVGAVGVCVVAMLVGMVWHMRDVMAGGDRARAAGERLGVLGAIGLVVEYWQQAGAGTAAGMSTSMGAGAGPGVGAGAGAVAGWVSEDRLTVGRDRWGRRVWIPVGERAGSHTLIVGATRSGKTCSEAWIAARLIERGHGAVVVDPKGDGLLRGELQDAARRMGVAFLEWSPHGPLAYNPYAHGDDDEVVEKALAGETFTEPHYLRQAQRYLGQAVRAMRAAQVPVTPGSLAAHMDPLQLEATVRMLPPEQAFQAQEYLEALSERQRRELSGVRDRLAILTESNFAPWLEPERAGGQIDLRAAVAERAVVYFALESDRRPLLAQMLACAVVTDLIALAGERHHDPGPDGRGDRRVLGGRRPAHLEIVRARRLGRRQPCARHPGAGRPAGGRTGRVARSDRRQPGSLDRLPPEHAGLGGADRPDRRDQTRLGDDAVRERDPIAPRPVRAAHAQTRPRTRDPPDPNPATAHRPGRCDHTRQRPGANDRADAPPERRADASAVVAGCDLELAEEVVG